MNTRLGDQTTTVDPMVRGIVTVTEAKPETLTTFQEIPDVGARWTLVASYGSQEVHRESLPRTTLVAGNWRIVIPADATRPLERAGFR